MTEIYSILNWNKFVKEAHPQLRVWFTQEEKWVEDLRGTAVLEVGCGAGRLLRHIYKHVDHAVGIDVEQGVLFHAQHLLHKVSNVLLSQQDGSCLSLKDHQFDHVICMGNTFGNFADSKIKILQEMSRVTKTGGTIALSVYNEHALKARLASYSHDELHQTNITKDGTVYIQEGIITEQFSEKKLKKIILAAGLTQFSITPFTSISNLVQIRV